MDPNETLLLVRRYSAEVQGIDDAMSQAESGLLLAEAVDALDTWISSGGFLPLAWENFGG